MMRTLAQRLLRFARDLVSRGSVSKVASAPPDEAAREEMTALFSQIYQQNVWGDAESLSGPGSTSERAAAFIDELVALLRSLDAEVLLDAPCGDFNWASPAADAVKTYIGVDVVPELIARLEERHSNPRRRFICRDLTGDALPEADVILCRDCLVHFSFHDIARAISNFKRSGSRFLLTTTFVDPDANRDIETGEWRPLNLRAQPFSFPEPLAVVDEKCLHSGGIYRDKQLALWRLASLDLRFLGS